eukprot:m.129698 g.129698  ORF g.129698 m.129698 type:complete len:313 (+) comp13050_c4_seq4:1190-2128(+)
MKLEVLLLVSLMSLSAFASFCGDGVVDIGEECDDGNRYNHDGCSGACVVELWFDCENIQSGTLCVPAERPQCVAEETGGSRRRNDVDVNGDGVVDYFDAAVAETWAECQCHHTTVKSFIYDDEGCAHCICKSPDVCKDDSTVSFAESCRCSVGCSECDFTNSEAGGCQLCQANLFLHLGDCVSSCPSDFEQVTSTYSDGSVYNRCVDPNVFGIPQHKVGGYVLGDFFNGEDTHLGTTTAPTEEVSSSSTLLSGLTTTEAVVVAVLAMVVAVACIAAVIVLVSRTKSVKADTLRASTTKSSYGHESFHEVTLD